MKPGTDATHGAAGWAPEDLAKSWHYAAFKLDGTTDVPWDVMSGEYQSRLTAIAADVIGSTDMIAELRATIAAERGQPEGALEGWERDGGGWRRVLTGVCGPTSWLWVATDHGLGAFVDDVWMPAMFGYTDTRKHEGEHSPHEISEWHAHAVGPREAMRGAEHWLENGPPA